MAELEIRPLTSCIGAEISGIDLRQEQPDSTIRSLESALHRHLVLFFRKQPITLAQQIAFTRRFGELLEVERASIFLVDRVRRELWLKVAQQEGGRAVDVRMPIDRGVAGQVATTGRTLRIDDAYASPLFNPEVDRETGFQTKAILCVPIADRRGEVFAVAQLLNKRDGRPFDEADEARFAEFARGIAPVLEGWVRMVGDRSPDRDRGT